MTRGSVSLSCATISHPSCFSKSQRYITYLRFWKLFYFRFMIGWIMVTLITQWFVIFFESKEVCAELINKGSLTGLNLKIWTDYAKIDKNRLDIFPNLSPKFTKDKEFERQKYFVRTLEDVTYVMKTEGTIFIFEWMFVLYGSFKIQEPRFRKSSKLK